MTQPSDSSEPLDRPVSRRGNLVISTVSNVTTVTVRDRTLVDGAAIDAIADRLYALVDQEDRRKILIDFSAVQFLSSTMLGALLSLHNKAMEAGGKVAIWGLKPEIRNVFKATQLDRMLAIAETEENAMALLTDDRGS